MKKEKTILVRVEETKHKIYKNLCLKHGLNMSQRFRNFITSEIEELNKKK